MLVTLPPLCPEIPPPAAPRYQPPQTAVSVCMVDQSGSPLSHPPWGEKAVCVWSWERRVHVGLNPTHALRVRCRSSCETHIFFVNKVEGANTFPRACYTPGTLLGTKMYYFI